MQSDPPQQDIDGEWINVDDDSDYEIQFKVNDRPEDVVLNN